MHRILLPFPLAIIGFLTILLAVEIPLFEWQISETKSDVSSAYDVDFASSPWFSRLGDSLSDKQYVFRWVFVSRDNKYCSTNGLNVEVKRSQPDLLSEQISLFLNVNEKTSPWLLGWALTMIVSSGIYMWWFAFWHENRPVSGAILSTVFSILILCYFLIPIMKLMGTHLSFAALDDCHGAIMFNAKLVEVHYAVPILLFIGFFAELGALTMMVRQIKAASKRNESSRSSVG